MNKFLLVLLMPPMLVYGQFQQLPTPIWENTMIKSGASHRIMEGPLKLPFWDDFSSSGVDSTKWISEGATQSFTVGNSAPTLGVVLLDGVDQSGRPYSNVQFEQGFTDRITSQPIDLSALPPTESNTVYLSFFWQAGGKGELPDPNDEISLQFLNPEGFWLPVWEKSGGLTAEQFFFTQEIIQVDPEFHHDAFQFRFQIRGRSSGPFDSWLLDYVFLNKNRTPTDINFQDRALTELNARPFEKYTAVPLFVLQKNPNGFWNRTANEFKNLDNTFRAMEYSIEIRESSDQNLIKSINSNTPFNPVPTAQERRSFNSNPFSEIPVPENETDYELVTYLVTGDDALTVLENGQSVSYPDIDFRINDTVRTIISIRDYFAYDDGSVDYSAGINQRSGMLATKYEVDDPFYLKGISINFTNFTQIGRVIDLTVWTDLDEEPVYVKEVFIPDKNELNEFAYFEIDQNLLLDSTFYIGFSQFTNDFVYVGLDKTFDNGQEIFFNVAGAWVQNQTVEGSLMMRPHLSVLAPVELDADGVIRGKVYPNPVTERLYVEGDFENFEIFDPMGRLLSLPMEEYEKGKIINFVGQQKGIYLLKTWNGQKQQKSIRILVK
ncbi:T9SS type A sorting domain-containing protein [Aquiflexum lacus]|uniref:T9SS type A sorting domain-containing protein n=1 Tax=Aquiflexum lacus TaxID=2483805 RepID=UPI001E4A8C73|nr:T9SS type A sorting domain-containing protein [Aquiflexum lacus]